MSIISLVAGAVKFLNLIVGMLDRRQLLQAGEAQNAAKALARTHKAFKRARHVEKELAALSPDALAARMRKRARGKKRVPDVSKD